MKKRSFPTVFSAVLLLIPLILCCALSRDPTAAYSAEDVPTVFLPDNRFADFMFQKSETNSVLISISNLDERVSYEDFKNFIVLKTRSGADVAFDYVTYGNAALMGFTLGNESVYLTLKEELNELPEAVRTDPKIETAIPLRVDNKSYLAATSSVRSGTVFLTIASREGNDDLMARADSYFQKNKFDVELAYHFDLTLSRLKLGEEEPVPLYFGSEGKKLKIRIEIPDYHKKYGYVLLTDLGAQGVSVKRMTVTETDGYHYVDAEITRNGSFSLIAYAEENLPWWAVLLIVGGGLLLFGGGAILGLYLKKKRNPKERISKKDDAPKEETKKETEKKDPETKDKESRNDAAT